MRFLIASALLTFVNVASATDWNIPDDALPKGCDASADAGLAHCSDLAFEKADAELNEVWKQVLARFDPKSPSGKFGFRMMGLPRAA
jgi:uncharacterized protein YecT (DUF1311 family)